MIRVENLSVRLDRFSLEHVSFEVEQGQYAVLMGKTGAGKTTLLECLCGLRPICGGRIWLAGREVSKLPPALRGVGYVPQDAALFPTMTVRGHLSFPLEIRRWSAVDIRRRTVELAALLSIEHLLDRRPRGLSGGESQRVALGRALAYRPGVLLLDEPLSALDEQTREQIRGLLERVKSHAHVTVLHITHRRGDSRRLADRTFQLIDGRLIEDELTKVTDNGELASVEKGSI